MRFMERTSDSLFVSARRGQVLILRGLRHLLLHHHLDYWSREPVCLACETTADPQYVMSGLPIWCTYS